MTSIRWTSAIALASATLLHSAAGWAQATPAIQILDRVETFDRQAVLDMNFDDPATRPPDFEVLISEPGSNFTICKLTATRGTFCLDGDLVRNWPSGTSAGGSTVVLNCNDPVFSLRKCTGLTADLG